jgi:hypothetical protein
LKIVEQVTTSVKVAKEETPPAKVATLESASVKVATQKTKAPFGVRLKAAWRALRGK